MSESTLKAGDAAPDFELMDENKNKVKLSDLRGKKVVLLFYPMDFSPVCTTEHCAFGADLPTIAGASDTVVFGEQGQFREGQIVTPKFVNAPGGE